MTELIDISALYPANGLNWRHALEVAVMEAVLLSLGIDPATIRDLREQTVEDEEIHLGAQEQSFQSRWAEITEAIRLGAIHPISRTSATGTSWNGPAGRNRRLPMRTFVEWAIGRSWTLPAWMTDGVAQPLLQPSTVAGLGELEQRTATEPTGNSAGSTETALPPIVQGRAVGDAALVTALIPFARQKWQTAQQRNQRISQAEIARAFYRQTGDTLAAWIAYGYSDIPEIKSLQNVLSSRRGEWRGS